MALLLSVLEIVVLLGLLVRELRVIGHWLGVLLFVLILHFESLIISSRFSLFVQLEVFILSLATHEHSFTSNGKRL